MYTLSESQSAFAKAILDPSAGTPADVTDPYGEACPKRFSVYRNNVASGLIECLRDNYPAVNRIVGNTFFSAMAREFVLTHPPRSPVMLTYGGGFAEFISHFEPAADIPYLPEIAQIERAWIEAYHAADAEPLSAGAFEELLLDELPNIRLTVHPSLRFINAEYPALDIWHMNLDGEVQPIDMTRGGQEILICRPHSEVEARRMPDGSVSFIEQLMASCSVLEAAQLSWARHPRFDIEVVLAGLLNCGAFIGWSHRHMETDSDTGVSQHGQ